MSSGKWMIYGAYGFTGELITGAAIWRGHSPILSGRSAEKLAPVAGELKLDMIVLDLKDEGLLSKTLEGVDLVINAAGPFVHTAMPIIRACLETRTRYLDISGEVSVIEQIFALEEQAQEKGIAIIPGVGFNVLASDCLALYAADQIENPTHLEIATLWAADEMSPGSTRTMIESFPAGTLARRGGQLVRINAANVRRQERFLDGLHTILPVAIGDLSTAYRTTHIPNITTYTAFKDQTADFYSLTEPVLRRLFSIEFVRRLASRRVKQTSSLSEKQLHDRRPSQIWVSVRIECGQEQLAWLETVDSYLFTAESAVLCVERLFAEKLVGVLTSALVFGADFVLVYLIVGIYIASALISKNTASLMTGRRVRM